MDYDVLEYNLVLVGWVIALMLGTFLLFINPPGTSAHSSYKRGKFTGAITMLMFGFELLFQWVMRFYLELNDPILSVSVYLFSFCAVSLLIALGFCSMLAPKMFTRRQFRVGLVILAAYTLLLIINYVIPDRRLQVTGLLVLCALLFIVTCISMYKCIAIYRRAIGDMRTYYADVVENLVRWMPGVGVGLAVFLLSAPIICLCPRWVGINQMALGVILILYTFVCLVNFSLRYNSVAEAFEPGKEGDDECGTTRLNDAARAAAVVEDGMQTSLSDSLREVIQDKEERWHSLGGYRQPGLTISVAARDMGTNRSYLSRYLNEVRHVTFHEWVAKMRIDEAQSLMLADPSLSIEQIAARVGFTSASTFSITFKKMVGISPNKWRNRQH